MSTETPESLSIAHFFLDLPSASSEVRKLLDRFINDDGVVVGWGLGRSGQLGTGTRNNLITPLVVCGNDKPVRIACSSASTVWLGALGAVHTMGGNTWGELGVPDPVLFPLLTETENGDIISVSHINLRQFNWRDVIVDVRGSYAFFAALSINGEVFLWGTNRYSQCTPHPNEPICPIPHQRFIPGKKIIQVSCSNYSVLALTEDGDVYGWGHTLLLGDEKSTLKQLSGGHFTVTVGDETRSVVMDPVRVDVLCGKLIEHIRTGLGMP
ncbi:putative Regulator of chromosome condensation (RCC1) repeat [Trypanosoma vivax]|nr:putative Regulator of chromosome condensation (RCC1) repeat [Trypanosoma vivax]